MFERYTNSAKQVVVTAQNEARALRHNYLGTEHLLLGLLREQGVAQSVLVVACGVDYEETRREIARIIGEGDESTDAQLPFTPRAKKVLKLALREALSRGHNYIGTEHILLGLVRENEGVAARILLGFDADAEKIRNEIIRMLSGPGHREEKKRMEITIHWRNRNHWTEPLADDYELPPFREWEGTFYFDTADGGKQVVNLAEIIAISTTPSPTKKETA